MPINEFTKEELETLAACIATYAKDHPDDYLPLFDKLCMKINTFCEHKNIGGEVELFADVCSNCDRILLRNKTLGEYDE